MATQQKLHIGQMIKAVFDESGMSVAELARRIHTARSNVYFIFERSSIDMEQLLDFVMLSTTIFWTTFKSKEK